MYDVFMIDPPWPKRKGGLRKVRPKQGRKLDYQTMNLDRISAMFKEDILCLKNSPHCVFLWTIDKFLHDAEIMMAEQGYKRHARFIWDKGNGVAPAFTVRFSHEYLLWFYKPTLMKVEKGVRGKYTTVIREMGRQHSRKPNIAYKMVEDFYPNATRYDVFARESRDGWDAFGDEMSRFN